MNNKKPVFKYLLIPLITVSLLIMMFPANVQAVTSASIIVSAPGDSTAVQNALDPWCTQNASAYANITALTITGTEISLSGLQWIRDNLPNLQILMMPMQQQIPDGTVGNGAFENHSQLTSLYLPSCTSIGAYAFTGDSKLTTVNIPLVLSIGTSAFEGATALTVASYPSVTMIADRAFYGATRLADISFTSVTTIGSQAFAQCEKLIHTNMPVVTTIGEAAFQNCILLDSISFSKATSIGVSAFENCVSMTDVNLQSVATIGDEAFSDCSSIMYYYFPAKDFSDPATAIAVGADAFLNTPNNPYYFAPDGSTNFDSYKLSDGHTDIFYVTTLETDFKFGHIANGADTIAPGGTANFDVNFTQSSVEDNLPGEFLLGNWTDWTLSGVQPVRSSVDPRGIVSIDPNETNSVLTLHATVTVNGFTYGVTKQINVVNSFTLTVNPASGGQADIASSNFGSNFPVNVAALPSNGYEFVKWLSDYPAINDSTTNPLNFFMPSQNLDLTPVFVNTACDVLTIIKPAGATLIGTDIAATLPNGTLSQQINVTISSGATWSLYTDSGCTIAADPLNTMSSLKIGTNLAYIKVIAEDGVTEKIYTVTLTILEPVPIPTPTPVILPSPTATPNTYLINQEPEASNQFTAVSNGPYSKLVSIMVDGRLLPSHEYVAWEGSTYVQFSSSFISHLALGWHTLDIIYIDGSASGNFYIGVQNTEKIWNITANPPTTPTEIINDIVDEETVEIIAR